MKGFLTLCISIIAFCIIGFPVAADEKEIADTLESVIISAAKSPVAYTGLKRLDRNDLIAGTAATIFSSLMECRCSRYRIFRS